MKYYGFIFARGGSKGLPRKNVKNLNGKPLIQYSIEIALKCPSIDKVIVSTDDLEISNIATKCGATVIDRPKELASDCSPEWMAWQHAIEFLQLDYIDFGFVSLPCTSPLRNVQDVEAAISKRRNTSADICISITESSRSPYFNMVQVDDNGFVNVVNKLESTVVRRQDVPKVFDITTVVYVSTASFIMNHQGIFSGNVVAVEVPKHRAIDIDDEFDFLMAEALIQKHWKEL